MTNTIMCDSCSYVSVCVITECERDNKHEREHEGERERERKGKRNRQRQLLHSLSTMSVIVNYIFTIYLFSSINLFFVTPKRPYSLTVGRLSGGHVRMWGEAG